MDEKSASFSMMALAVLHSWRFSSYTPAILPLKIAVLLLGHRRWAFWLREVHVEKVKIMWFASPEMLREVPQAADSTLS